MSFLEPGQPCRFSSGGWCWAHASLKCKPELTMLVCPLGDDCLADGPTCIPVAAAIYDKGDGLLGPARENLRYELAGPTGAPADPSEFYRP